MRLWTLDPKYLDPQGLVALWREALLARAVIRGETRSYLNHPQLLRFKAHPAPRSAINAYLKSILAEAEARAYGFDGSKIGPVRAAVRLRSSMGQLEYEWRHLLMKLRRRSPAHYQSLRHIEVPEANVLFVIRPGAVEYWEKRSGSR